MVHQSSTVVSFNFTVFIKLGNIPFPQYPTRAFESRVKWPIIVYQVMILVLWQEIIAPVTQVDLFLQKET